MDTALKSDLLLFLWDYVIEISLFFCIFENLFNGLSTTVSQMIYSEETKAIVVVNAISILIHSLI